MRGGVRPGSDPTDCRLGGWLFLGLGALFLLTGVLGLGRSSTPIIGAVLAVVLILFVCCYVVWRGDPEKQSPADTGPADEVHDRGV